MLPKTASTGQYSVARRTVLIGCVLIVATAACTPVSAGPSTAPSGPPFGGTLRVVMPGFAFSDLANPEPKLDALDPQISPWYDAGELFRCCLLRTLVGYTGRPASEGGAELQPDLAVKLPQATENGHTWTFRIRPGVHYSPPMEGVEVTAADFVRSLQRDARLSNDGSAETYSVIEGFESYGQGKATTISGLEALDRYTLKVHLNQALGDLPDRFALPDSAPIPPSPTDPAAPFGVASGHDSGYGRFLVSSGPYMIEGSPRLDFSMPADQQLPVSGYRPGHSLTLVRNPEWKRSQDALRPAYLDSIQIVIGPSRDDAATMLDSGKADLVLLAAPPFQVQRWLVQKVRANPRLGKVSVYSRDFMRAIMMNLAVPPFDDVHVRKAVNYIIDKGAILDLYGGPDAGKVATHFAVDSLETDALAAYDPYGSPQGEGRVELAQREMKQSSYDLKHAGTCSAPVCKHVLALTIPQTVGAPWQEIGASIAKDLAQIGITLDLKATKAYFDLAGDPTKRIPLALTTGLGYSFMNASSDFDELSSSSIPGDNESLVGATPDQLRRWGYAVRVVPSIDSRISDCRSVIAVQRQIECWGQLDAYVMEQVVPVVPYVAENVVAVFPPQIVHYSFDQANTLPALDQIALKH